MINPAYAGSRESLSAIIDYRNQWTKINGAPETILLSVHSISSNRKYGFGANLYRDKIAVFENYTLNANYAYRIFIGKSILSLGINGGIAFSDVDASGLTAFQQGDVAAFGKMDGTHFIPNLGAGIYYKTKKMALGFSVPQIFNDNNLSGLDIPLSNHYFISFDYLINIGKQYSLEGQRVALLPSFLMKMVPNTDFQMDFNLNLIFYSQFWLGMGYRSDNSLIFSAQYALNQFVKNGSMQFRIGYAYDVPPSRISNATNGSHEIFLMYDISKNKNKILSPRLF